MARSDCVNGVCDPQRKQGLQAPAPEGDYVLIDLQGPGLFLAAEVTKQGGASNLSFVHLEIDGRNVTAISYIAAENLNLTRQNPYGLVLLQRPPLTTLTIGFPSPLRFKRNLKVSVKVSETGVDQLLANVIYGT